MTATTFVPTHETYQEGARTLPGRLYTSPDVYHAEVRHIFHRQWVCVGRESQIADAGDYFLADIGGESIIVVRDRAGEPRAFYNVCRHRGTRLCEARQGRFSATIQCPYHAWTYALDGRLTGAPQMRGATGFNMADYPLIPAAVETWDGFLFVSLAYERVPLPDWLEPLVSRLARFRMSSLVPVRRIEYDVAANWKLIFQNYSECLHCPTLHPALNELTPYTSGENDLVEGPFLGGFMTLRRGGGSMTMSGRACARPVAELPDEDLERVYYYSVFPNLLLSLHPDYVMFHTIWPQAPARTRIVCEWLFHPDANRSPGFNPDDAVEFWDMTNRQDWHICEQAQAGVSSRVYVPGPYSPRESIPAAWDREYLRRMQNGWAG